MAERCGEHKFDSWKHFSQQLDLLVFLPLSQENKPESEKAR
jgi:hypothetical protein